MKKNNIALISVTTLVGFLLGYFSVPFTHGHEEMHNMSDRMESHVTNKDDMIASMMADGDYACCLTKACVYCIEKSPGHGEGATCRCLDDVINGVHPCGECIGEILEGHGNKFLAKYFAKAIAEEVGEDHIGTIKEIISEKYDITIEDQI